MTKRIISLVLVFVMLFAICMTTASCAQLEEFIGEENLGEDYMNKYYPDRNTADGGNTPDTPDEPDDGNDEKPEEIIKGEHVPGVEREEGHNLITFYWNKGIIKDISDCDLWWWYGDESGATCWEECSYGARVTLSVPDDITEVGFIVRTNCTQPGDGSSWGNADKDCGADDLFATIEGPDTFIYLKSGDAKQYQSFDGGKTLKVIQKFNFAGMLDLHTIEYNVTPSVRINRLSQVKLMDGDREVEIKEIDNINLSKASGKITVEEELDITKKYTLYIEGFGEQTIVPTDIFDTKWFADNYHYSGTDLGATINGDGTTTFKVWAPTASQVVLNLYKDGQGGTEPVSSPEDRSIDMIRGEKGVWSYTSKSEENIGHGTFYTYSVTTSVGTQEAVDPYAKTAGVNGDRGMVVDLSLTNPDGWDASDATFEENYKTKIDNYSDAVIWEIHIRDFSNTINFGEDLNDRYQGKYIAFTKEGLVNENGIPVGIDYLKQLGVNYVHLLPSYDYETVDEANPDSGFNWGYDPKNYNVPEGSYATNPYDGVTRIKEYKQMVMALHDAGIGVIMDVVYNHTFNKNASLNRIVPHYYYRYKDNGAHSSCSGCGNDTASERYMYGKFMVESVSYWQQEYNLDGFRFDLMGLHDIVTMQRIEAAVHTHDPRAIIYGEGWQMMQNSYGDVTSAWQANISQITKTNGAIGTIAVFNDVIRIGLKGEDNDASRGFMTGNTGMSSNGQNTTRKHVLFGVNGGSTMDGWWGTVKDNMVVNYMSAHDGTTIWDKIAINHGSTDATLDTRLKMNRLGATIIMTSKGIAFMQAGEEMLRSKPNEKDPNGYDRNSYKSSDEVNNLRWDLLSEESAQYGMMQYYAGLIAIRKTYGVFSGQNCTFVTSEFDKGYIITITTDDGGSAVVLVNPDKYAKNFNLPEGISYNLICDGKTAGTTKIGTDSYSGSIKVSGYSAFILVNDVLLNNPR